MATWIDDAVGALLGTLDELNLSGNTVVIFLSDHGNRGKESVYEAARAPMLIRWPGHIQPGSVSHALVANIDLAPTVAALAGATLQVDVDGLNLEPVWTQEADQIRDGLMLEMSMSRAVVTKDWKYMANRPPPEVAKRMTEEASLPQEERRHGWDGNWQRNPAGEWQQSPRINYRNQMLFPAYFDLDQLYDLRSDNMEQVNVAADEQHARRLKTMQQLLVDLLRATDQPIDWYFPEEDREERVRK